MKREEIIALAEKMMQGQTAIEKYVQHYTTFLSEDRCKKGIIAFLAELFDKDSSDPESIRSYQFDYPALMIQLSTGKSNSNSRLTSMALREANIETRGFVELTKQRKEFMTAIIECLVQTRNDLDKSELSDARARQVYLRRAVARLITVCHSRPLVAITADQWSEVEPWEYCDYLSVSMDELVERLRPSDDSWLSVCYEQNGLDARQNVESILSFMDYLDTFLQY